MVIVGAVLAAGAGVRYGMPKIVAQQGEWLNRAVTALRSGGCDDVLVAMGARIVEAPAHTTAVVVEDWAQGLSATVGAVLRSLQSRPEVVGAVLHVVDMPDVGPAVVRRVLAAADGQSQALVRARYGDSAGHPVFIGSAHFAGVLSVLGGDSGAQRYFAGRSDIQLVDCGDLASGLDCDTRGQEPRR